MEIKISNKNGVILQTKDKYCDDNIIIRLDPKIVPDTTNEIATPEEMDELLLNEENLGKIYVYIGPTTDKYINGAMYQVTEE